MSEFLAMLSLISPLFWWKFSILSLISYLCFLFIVYLSEQREGTLVNLNILCVCVCECHLQNLFTLSVRMAHFFPPIVNIILKIGNARFIAYVESRFVVNFGVELFENMFAQNCITAFGQWVRKQQTISLTTESTNTEIARESIKPVAWHFILFYYFLSRVLFSLCLITFDLISARANKIFFVPIGTDPGGLRSWNNKKN